MKKLISLCLIIFSFFVAPAQDQVIFSDRPTATDAVSLIYPGTFQVEFGYKATHGQTKIQDNVTIHELPNLSLKYGLTDWLEFRVISHYMISPNPDIAQFEGKSQGIEQVTISPKFGILKQRGIFPTLSMVTSFTKPLLLNINYGPTDMWLFNSTLLFEYKFGKFSWSNSFGTIWMEEVWKYSSMGSYPITDKLGFFLECFGLSSFPYDFNADFGFTYLLSDNFQLDIIYGGLLYEGPLADPNKKSRFLGFGVALNTNFKD